MAVAIKNEGYTNIKIYNGGLKDWLKSTYETVSIDPLPEYKARFIGVAELLAKIQQADKKNCVDNSGQPLLTLIDFRVISTSPVRTSADHHRVKSTCKTITATLDDFIDNDQLIQSIPKSGLVVSVSETGNRDVFLIRYLSKFGRLNVQGLKYGMRNWLKADYPTSHSSNW